MQLKEICLNVLEGESGAAEYARNLPPDNYAADLPWMLDTMYLLDPRVVYHNGELSIEALDTMGELFQPLQNLQTAELLEQVAETSQKLVRLGKWWAHMLKNSEHWFEGIAIALQHILDTLIYVSEQGKGTQSQMLELCFAVLPINNEIMAEKATQFVRNQFSRNPKLPVHYGDNMIDVLDSGFMPSLGGNKLMGFLLETVKGAPEVVLNRVDVILQCALEGISSGTKILEIAAKHNPRPLFVFVNSLLKIANESFPAVINILELIASKSVAVLQPFLDDIIKLVNVKRNEGIATEAIQTAYTVLGLVGRADPQSAAKTVNILVGIVKEGGENDILMLLKILKNIGGVYKQAVKPHVSTLYQFTSSSSGETSDEARTLVEYLRSANAYLEDSLLRDQEDVWGYKLKMNDSPTDFLQHVDSTIEEVTYRADHFIDESASRKDFHFVSPENWPNIKQPKNQVEIAIKDEHAIRRNQKPSSAETIERKISSQEARIRVFLDNIADRFPLPFRVVAVGELKKRLQLTFRCERAEYPELVLTTCHWAKWIRLLAGALYIGRNITLSDSVDGGSKMEELVNLFESVRRDVIDPLLTLKTLCAKPYLNPEEYHELLADLEHGGLFLEFSWFSPSATWCRRRVGLPNSMDSNSASSADDSATASSHENISSRSLGVTQSERDVNVSPVLEGWLEKYGGGRKTMGMKAKSSRYFELTDEKLNYYKDDSKNEKKGTVFLSSIRSVEVGKDGWMVLHTPSVHGDRYDIRPLNSVHVEMIRQRIESGPMLRRENSSLPNITSSITGSG